MPSPLIYPKFQGIAPVPTGAAAAGYKLKSFYAGTSTPLATYTDSTLSVANPTTIILDANGEANVWLGIQAYKFIFTDPADVVQWTVDNVSQAGMTTGGGGTLAPLEWIPLGIAPTYVNGFSFSVTGVTDLTLGPYFWSVGTRIRTQNNPAGIVYSTITSIAANVVVLKHDTATNLDVGLSAAWYGMVTTFLSVPRKTLIGFQGGTAQALTSGAQTTISVAGTTTMDALSEVPGGGGVATIKVTGIYRASGIVTFVTNAATTTIFNVAQSVSIRKNAVATVATSISWPFANLTAATVAIPFNINIALTAGDVIDFSVQASFTATAPTAALTSFTLERMQ